MLGIHSKQDAHSVRKRSYSDCNSFFTVVESYSELKLLVFAFGLWKTFASHKDSSAHVLASRPWAYKTSQRLGLQLILRLYECFALQRRSEEKKEGA